MSQFNEGDEVLYYTREGELILGNVVGQGIQWYVDRRNKGAGIRMTEYGSVNSVPIGAFTTMSTYQPSYANQRLLNQIHNQALDRNLSVDEKTLLSNTLYPDMRGAWYTGDEVNAANGMLALSKEPPRGGRKSRRLKSRHSKKHRRKSRR
jgi:hypothetical protein